MIRDTQIEQQANCLEFSLKKKKTKKKKKNKKKNKNKKK
jgi:hypothetical protein